MTWARFDDLFDDHRKIKKVWRADTATVGLHVMAITYCSRHETDGLVDAEFVAEKLPKDRDRHRVVEALLDAGLWSVDGNGWRVHDYLVYNPSHAELEAKRTKDAVRKADGRRKAAEKREREARERGDHAEADRIASELRPQDVRADAARNPSGVRAASSGPDPTRPDPTRSPPNPPDGGNLPDLPTRPGGQRARDVAAFEEQLRCYVLAAFPDIDPSVAIGYLQSALNDSKRPATHESVAEYVRRWTSSGQDLEGANP